MTQQEVQTRIAGVLEANFGISPDRVSPEATFRGALGMDSLDVVDFIFFVQQEFGFKAQTAEFRDLHTVSALAAFIETKAAAV